MKGGEPKPMRINEMAEADVANIRLAEEIAKQRRAYQEGEDPEFNYMVHFSNVFNANYEA